MLGRVDFVVGLPNLVSMLQNLVLHCFLGYYLVLIGTPSWCYLLVLLVGAACGCYLLVLLVGVYVQCCSLPAARKTEVRSAVSSAEALSCAETCGNKMKLKARRRSLS